MNFRFFLVFLSGIAWTMVVQRKSGEGQTMLIAISKWIGTLAPSILFGILGISGGEMAARPMPFVLVIGILITIFDLIYITMLAKTKVGDRELSM